MRRLVALVTIVGSLTVLLSAQRVPASRAWTDIAELDISVLDRDREASGQQSQIQAPLFRASLDLVQIDVTAVDKLSKRPVRGLTAADFRLVEEGHQREILGFAEINIPDPMEGPAWMRDVHPDVRTATDGRVLVFLIDDASIPSDRYAPSYQEAVSRIASDVIDRMGPTDVAAVLCTFDSGCAQDFTNDRALLRKAVRRFAPKSFATGGGYSWSRQAAGTATAVAKYLAEQPGRRKALIFVTPRIPVKPDPWPPITCPAPRCVSLEEASTQQQVIRLFQNALKSRVAVYGISPMGLSNLSAVDSARPQGRPTVDVASLFGARKDSLAAETGGFVVGRPEEAGEAVAQIFRETGSYYLLGFQKHDGPPSTKYNKIPGFRSVAVLSNRPDVEIRVRTGYVDATPDGPGSQPPANAQTALAGILPNADLPLRVSVAPFAIPGRREAALTIVLGIAEPPPTARTSDRLDLQFRSFTQRGDPRAMNQRSVDVVLPPSNEASASFEVLSQLDLKPGTYALRFSAWSARLEKAGSVYADVEIQDFQTLPLSMSGLILSSAPGSAAGSSNELSSILPVTPTTLREFAPDQHVLTFARIYQGGKRPQSAVTVVLQIVNEMNQVVTERKQSLSPSLFAAASEADFRHELPMSGLTPGPYLLTVRAVTDRATAERHVRFTVR